MNCRILITCPPMLMTLSSCRERFTAENLEIIAPEVKQQLSEDQLCEIIADYDGVIAGDDPFTAKVLAAGRKGRLKVLAKWGIGVDAIDLVAAKRLGILTSNTPDVFGDEVADVAIGYTILLARQLHRIDAAVREGHWLKIRGMSLHGKVLGIVGLGSIGRAIARRCHAMGMTLLGHDIAPIAEDIQTQFGLKQVSLETLLGQSDIILLACALTPQNRYMLDERAFGRMKQGVLLVNVARGPLIKENALLAALENKLVGGAALDVFEHEPLSREHPLCRYEQVILGSHNSSNTQEAVHRVNQMAIDNLVRDLKKVCS